MSKRTFLQEASPRERVEFTLGGKTVDADGNYDGGDWSEDFVCLPELPMGALDDLSRSVGTDERTGEPRYNQPSVIRFVAAALPEAQALRFEALCHDKRRIVSMSLLENVVGLISEELGGRPTTP